MYPWRSILLLALLPIVCIETPPPPDRENTKRAEAPAQAASTPPSDPLGCKRWNEAPSWPLPTSLGSAWSWPDGSVTAFSYPNVVAHYDGSRWSTTALEHSVRASWGDSDGTLYTVGSDGQAQRYSNGAWSSLPTGTEYDLNDVWGFSPTSIYVVGSNGTVLHFDGAQWSSIEVPSRATLVSVWGSSENDLFVGGHEGTLLHFDGTRWRKRTVPTTETITRIDGSGPRDVWMLAGGSKLLRFNGTGFRVMRSGNEELYLVDVLVRGENDVLLSRQDPSRLGKASPAAERFTGKWQAIASGNLADSVEWSRGPGPTTFGFAEHGAYRLRGKRLTPSGRRPIEAGLQLRRSDRGRRITGSTRMLDLPRHHNSELLEVWQTSTLSLAAARRRHDADPAQPLLLRLDVKRERWQEEHTPEEQPTTLWGLGDTVWALGERGSLHRREKDGWQKLPFPHSLELVTMWGTAPDRIYVVAHESSNSRIFQYDGTSWRPQRTFPGVHLRTIWGTANDDIYVGGGTVPPPNRNPGAENTKATLFHFDGEHWTRQLNADGHGDDFVHIWGNSKTDVFALRTLEYEDGGEDYSTWKLHRRGADGWHELAHGNGAAPIGWSSPRLIELGTTPATYFECAELDYGP